jgi:hypothetical protein
VPVRYIIPALASGWKTGGGEKERKKERARERERERERE